MPLDAPVTIATLLDSLLIIHHCSTPVPPNVHRSELRLARMKISIYAPYAKERFESARQQSILHPERIVGNPGSDPEECRGRASIAAAKQFCQNIRHCASSAGPRQRP